MGVEKEHARGRDGGDGGRRHHQTRLKEERTWVSSLVAILHQLRIAKFHLGMAEGSGRKTCREGRDRQGG